MTKITLIYSSCDGYQEAGEFDNQADAVAFLAYWLCDSRGVFDDAGHYAVSADGVGRVTGSDGTLLEDLWKYRGERPEFTKFRNLKFEARHYECTNVVACELVDGRSLAPAGEWQPVPDEEWRRLVEPLTPLFVENYVRYWGYL